MVFHKATELETLWCGEMMACVIADQKVLIVRVDSGVYAYEDKCPHLGVALSERRLEGDVLTCSAHHYQYDVCNGRSLNPKNICLKPYSVKIQNGAVLVNTDESVEKQDVNETA